MKHCLKTVFGDDDNDDGLSELNVWLLDDILKRGGNSVSKKESRNEIELEKYFLVCEQSKIRDPLQWWSTNRATFPTLAWLARKWMSAISTSVPSERFFHEQEQL